MGLFRRARRSESADELPAAGSADEMAASERAAATSSSGAASTTPADVEPERFDRSAGPFDSSEVEPDSARLDLGSIQLVPLEGMQLQLELDASQQSVVAAHAFVGGSGVQLQAFAAPRTVGLWPQIRSEIAESIVSQGGTVDVVPGPLGVELLSRMPSRGADGRTVLQPVRFLGVDGPRWFLRAVLSGPAVLDEAQAEPLLALVRGVVVVRGEEARPPREGLPLRLPEPAQPEDPAPRGGRDDLTPFQRGPEITEVR